MAVIKKRIHVHGYSYKRNGKKIAVPGYYYYVSKNTTRTRGKGEGKSRATATTEQPRGKKSLGKERGRSPLRNATGGKANRLQKARHRIDKRKKPVGRVAHKDKVSVSSKRRRRAGRGKAKAISRKASVAVTHPRGEQKIELVFTQMGGVDGKVNAVKGSQSLIKEIEKQLRRKGGRPPMGVVILIEDKDGHIISRISPPDMVINLENVIEFLASVLKELKDNYDPDMGEDDETDGDGSGWGNNDPKNIHKVTIKFIYGK